MYILGIQYSNDIMCHDTGAALIQNNNLLGVLEEERFIRIKHSGSIFPINSITYLLTTNKLDISQIDLIVISKQYPINDCKLDIKNFFNYDILPNKIIQCDHHLAHMLNSYYCSKIDDRCLSLVVDGEGDEKTTMNLSIIEKSTITNIKKFKTEVSLGYFYEHASIFCGFGLFGCGKLMGLASYGKVLPYQELYAVNGINITLSKYYERYLKLIKQSLMHQKNKYDLYLKKYSIDFSYYDIDDKSNIVLLLKYFETLYPFSKLQDKNELIYYINFAATIQNIFEKTLISFLKNVKKIYNVENLVISGGCIQNCSFNNKLVESSIFKKIYCSPNLHDGGIALGFALYGAKINNINTINNICQFIPYAGRQYEINSISENYKHRITIEKYDVETVAKDISNNKILIWFFGGAEAGPRALCHRSIIANVQFRSNLSTINLNIKHRENFRPLAPVIMDKLFFEIFDTNNSDMSEFMLRNISIRKSYRKKLAAVCHIDNTSRPQYLCKSTNPEIYNLLDVIYQKYNILGLINTSLNDKYEPIIETIDQAINMLLNCNQLDYIVFNAKTIIRRK